MKSTKALRLVRPQPKKSRLPRPRRCRCCTHGHRFAVTEMIVRNALGEILRVLQGREAS